jgi:hypothetical protein
MQPDVLQANHKCFSERIRLRQEALAALKQEALDLGASS